MNQEHGPNLAPEVGSGVTHHIFGGGFLLPLETIFR